MFFYFIDLFFGSFSPSLSSETKVNSNLQDLFRANTSFISSITQMNKCYKRGTELNFGITQNERMASD
jgi:hypothetical protein